MNAMNEIAKEVPMVKQRFLKAIKDKSDRFREDRTLDNLEYDEAVFKRIKGILGGRIRVLVSGGAPLS